MNMRDPNKFSLKQTLKEVNAEADKAFHGAIDAFYDDAEQTKKDLARGKEALYAKIKGE